jgi:hypothetical protein
MWSLVLQIEQWSFEREVEQSALLSGVQAVLSPS